MFDSSTVFFTFELVLSIINKAEVLSWMSMALTKNLWLDSQCLRQEKSHSLSLKASDFLMADFRSGVLEGSFLSTELKISYW